MTTTSNDLPISAPDPWSLKSERELQADLCRRDFWSFVKIAWGLDRYMAGNPQDRWLTERLHRPICTWMQAHVEEWEEFRRKGMKKRKRLVLVIPRFFAKTLLATKALSLWVQLRNPDIASFIGSEVATKAEDFLFPIKQVMEGSDPNALFAELYGSWYDPNRRWTNKEVVHAARRNVARTEPSFSTWGVGGGVTGLHPDFGIMDDPLSEEKISESGAWLSYVNRSMAALRPAFRPDSFFMLVCTRYRDNDVAGTFFKQGIRSWHGMKPPDKWGLKFGKENGWDVYFLQALDSEGNSIWPEVWPTEQLLQYEEEHPVEFAAQMQNDPGSGEHMPLTQEQIDDMWIDAESVPSNLAYVIVSDTAFKEGKRIGSGDESVWQLWGIDLRGTGDVYYLEGNSSNRWRGEDYFKEVSLVVQRYRSQGKRIRAWIDEKLIGGKEGIYENSIRSWFGGVGLLVPPLIFLSRAGVKKEIRIREAFNLWVDGHVKLVRGAPGVHKLIGQAVRYGVVEHDDWVDCAADVFCPEVYRPLLNVAYANEEAGYTPDRPGELSRRLPRKSATQYWDEQHGEWWDSERMLNSDEYAR